MMPVPGGVMHMCTAGVLLPATKEVMGKKVGKARETEEARESLGAGEVAVVAEGCQTVAKSASMMAFRPHMPTARQSMRRTPR